MTEIAGISRTQLVGAYNLWIRLSSMKRDLIIDPQSIKELTITQDINSFLPSLRMTIPSAGEEYIHIVPLDLTLRISIYFGYDLDIFNAGNGFNFLVYRRFPRATDQVFDIEGLLDIGDLFDRQHIRGFSGTVYDTIETIAQSLILQEDASSKEGNQQKVEMLISDSLKYKLNLIQHNQTNAEFLSYLMDNLAGKGNEGAYYCFLRNRLGKTTFVFQTLEEILSAPGTIRLCYGATAFPQDNETNEVTEFAPVWNYEIVDNYKLEALEGAKSVKYTYFNYDTGEMAAEQIYCDDFYSLTSKFAIQKSSPDVYLNSPLGRTNDFTNTFLGKETSKYHRRLINLERIRISTYGTPDACPGDVVQLLFASPVDFEKQMDFQYQGFWMIESVQHSFGMQFSSTFILVRNGVDTSITNNLVEARRKRKE